MNIRLAASITALILSAGAVCAQTTEFTYQGRLTDNSAAATGNYDLRFTLYNAAAGGGVIGGAITINPAAVTAGLFTVPLDFGAAALPGADRWLEIAVRPAGSAAAYTVLAPRQKLTSAPYAARAASATTAATAAALSGNITAAQVSGGTLNPSLIADGSILSQKIVSVAGSTITGTIADGVLSTNIPRLNGNPVFTQSLTVNSTIAGTGGYNSSNTGGTWFNLGNSSDEKSTIWNFISTGPGNSEGVGKLLIRDEAAGAVRLTISGTGNTGIGTTAPRERLQVDGPDATIAIHNTNDTLGAFVENTFSTIQLGLYNPTAAANSGLAANTKRAYFGAEPSTGRVGSMTNTTGAPVFRNLLDDGNGRVGIGLTNPGAALDVAITATRRLRMKTDTNSIPVIEAISSDSLDTLAGYMRMRHAIEVWPNTAGTQGGKVDVRDKTGATTITLDGQSGEATVTVLNITGGSDIAEPFQMSGDIIAAGSVVIIDEEHPGRLKLSDCAYDTRVAGIVSGANGVDPGLSLHQKGVLEGGQNVALTGRVYAMADAGSGPIKPGDLLTTSNIPGHIMKASDRERSHGAILGKAMSGLNEGAGFVLVLVNLQ